MTTKDSKTPKASVYNYEDVDFNKIEISELNMDYKQPMRFLTYNDPDKNFKTKLYVKTSGKIKLPIYGIPPLDAKNAINSFHPDDKSREFIKVPLIEGDQACDALRRHLEEVDEWAASAETRKRVLGKGMEKFEYKKCIKTAEPSSNPKSTFPVVDSVTFKFDMYNEGDDRINKTKLKRIEDGKRGEVVAKTIGDIAKEIGYMSELRIIFNYHKFWFFKANKLYGISLKAMVIEYTPGIPRSVEVDFSSDDEGTEIPAKTTKNVKQIQSKPQKSQKPPKLDDSQGNNEENNNDDENNDIPVESSDTNNKKNRKKKSQNETEEKQSGKEEQSGKGKNSKITQKKKNNKRVESDNDQSGNDEPQEDDHPQEIKATVKKSIKSTKNS